MPIAYLGLESTVYDALPTRENKANMSYGLALAQVLESLETKFKPDRSGHTPFSEHYIKPIIFANDYGYSLLDLIPRGTAFSVGGFFWPYDDNYKNLKDYLGGVLNQMNERYDSNPILVVVSSIKTAEILAEILNDKGYTVKTDSELTKILKNNSI